jgi:hypothetical protein
MKDNTIINRLPPPDVWCMDLMEFHQFGRINPLCKHHSSQLLDKLSIIDKTTLNLCQSNHKPVTNHQTIKDNFLLKMTTYNKTQLETKILRRDVLTKL